MYHRPLRLSVVIQAPKERIQTILQKNPHLQALLDNEWIYLLVMDPNQKNDVTLYETGMSWTATTAEKVFEVNLN